jgi:hypothetical protein
MKKIDIIYTKEEALQANSRYFKGSECKHGHTSGIRYVKSGACVECVNTNLDQDVNTITRSKSGPSLTPEESRQRKAAYAARRRQRDEEAVKKYQKEYQAKYRKENAEKLDQYRKEYYANKRKTKS